MVKLMRLFIAIDFTNEKKDCLYQTIQDLKKNAMKGTFTHKENLHLTLAFIGETKELDNVKQAMNRAVSKMNIKAFEFFIKGLGQFKSREGDIYWVGVEHNPILSDLSRALVKELKYYEFKIDDREFKPHLTLGRGVVVPAGFNKKEFGKTIPTMIMKATRISLMKSERIEGKLVYTEVYSCELG
jgi:2'-5' RNA ligase